MKAEREGSQHHRVRISPIQSRGLGSQSASSTGMEGAKPSSGNLRKCTVGRGPTDMTEKRVVAQYGAELSAIPGVRTWATVRPLEMQLCRWKAVRGV